jgi:hypothetical protein
VVEPAHLARLMFDDGLAERDLAVARHDQLGLMPDGEDRRCVRMRIHSSGIVHQRPHCPGGRTPFSPRSACPGGVYARAAWQ